MADYRKKKYAANRERRIVDAVKWAKENPEKRKLVCARYQKTERGRQKSIEITERRRARIYGAPGRGVTMAQFHEVCDEYEDHCLMCLKKVDRKKLTMDHVVPISIGGAHDVENLQPLCQPCNRLKGTYTIDYRPTFWWRGPSRGADL